MMLCKQILVDAQRAVLEGGTVRMFHLQIEMSFINPFGVFL